MGAFSYRCGLPEALAGRHYKRRASGKSPVIIARCHEDSSGSRIEKKQPNAYRSLLGCKMVMIFTERTLLHVRLSSQHNFSGAKRLIKNTGAVAGEHSDGMTTEIES